MAMLGEKIENDNVVEIPYFAVKQSTFPFDRFLQDNIILGPKMRSTGETMGLDYDAHHAVLKSYRGNYPGLGRVGKIMLSLADENKSLLNKYLPQLQKIGHSFIGTPGTAKYIQQLGIPCAEVGHIYTAENGTIVDILKDPEIILVANTPMNQGKSQSEGETIRNTAIQYGLPCFTRPENIEAVFQSLISTYKQDIHPLSLQESATSLKRVQNDK
jgi:carbamoyl-phosphate synthase large subunit